MDLLTRHWSVVTFALVISSVIALIANSLLLLVFCRRRGLRTVANRFTINLLLTNLFSSVLLIPLLIVDGGVAPPSDLLVIETFSGNNTLCYVAQSTVGFVCTASILGVLLIGVDQYFAVIHSLRYHAYINKSRSMILIGASWTIAFFFAVLSGLTQNASNLWQFCTRGDESDPGSYVKILNSIYAVFYFGGVTLLPFIAICAIYVCIYSAAHNSSERLRSTKANHRADSYMEIPTTLQKTLIPKVQSAPNLRVLTKDDLTSSVKRSMSERVGFITRLWNSPVFRYREETRAAKISILVIFMVLACYVPYGLAVVLNSNLVKITTPRFYNYAALVLLMASDVVSPFLFAYRNRRIRRELLKLLRIARANPPNFTVPVLRRRSEEVPTTIRPYEAIPQVIITCKIDEAETKPSILKRVCSTKSWGGYKKCTFIPVPQSCYQTESARGSFSSASTQTSTDDG